MSGRRAKRRADTPVLPAIAAAARGSFGSAITVTSAESVDKKAATSSGPKGTAPTTANTIDGTAPFNAVI